MPGLLLIARENGRSVKTYGVKGAETRNMKFAFLCTIAVISCGVCASGDLEIYPGLKYNFDREERRSRLDNYEDPNIYQQYYRHSWDNTSPLDDYGEIETKKPYELYPEILRQFYRPEFAKPRHGNHQPRYETPTHRYEFEEIYKQFKDSNVPGFKSYGLGNQILDDVRMYPQDDDFSFKNEVGEEEVAVPKTYRQSSLEDQDRMLSPDKIGLSGDAAVVSDTHHDHQDTKLTEEEQFPSGQYEYAKVVEDSSEFAYAPSDPRFYKNPNFPKDLDAEDEKTTVDNTSEGPFEVKSRSEQNLREEGRGRDDTLYFKSSIGGITSRTGVDMVAMKPIMSETNSAGVYIIAIVAGISAAATVGLIAVAIGWYNLQKHVKNASDVEYPAYGVTGPNKDISPSGDRRLAQSAQMYHYQHQKQQIIAMERAPPTDRHGSVSDADSEEDNEEGDYTVYECPGLAPTGEMEVKNPLFQDDPTPAQTPAIKSSEESK